MKYVKSYFTYTSLVFMIACLLYLVTGRSPTSDDIIMIFLFGGWLIGFLINEVAKGVGRAIAQSRRDIKSLIDRE